MKHKTKKESRKTNLPFLSILVVLIFIVCYISIVGLTIKEYALEFSEPLNLELSESKNYQWELEKTGKLQSVKVSGAVEGEGYVKVSLDDLLILDSSNIKARSLTGRAIGEEVKQFEDLCEETCNLNLSKSSYNLKIEVDNATLKLDEIKYKVVQENAAEQTESSEQLERERIVIGQPVKWTKQVKLDTPGMAKVEVPEQAEGIEVKKITEEKEEKAKFSMTVKAILESQSVYNFLLSFTRNLLLTGKAITEEQEKVIEITIEDDAAEYEIEYYTEAPAATEAVISQTKKFITVSAPDELNYEDILAYTSLPSEAPAEAVKLYIINDVFKQEVEVDKYDLNENGLIDYIEWTVPHLSNQTYELIIQISKAEHLDENRVFMEDIFEELEHQDSIWKEIPDSHYIRVKFEAPLDNTRDITIYAKGSGSIEVYKRDGNEILAVFTISEEKRYKVLLTSLEGREDVFDLRVTGGEIEIDYIVDPSECTGEATACNTFSTSGTCADQENCLWEGCTGTPGACSGYTDSTLCELKNCVWDGCTGTPDPCAFRQAEPYCSDAGCSWDACEGGAITCDDLDGSNEEICNNQSGCTWYGPGSELYCEGIADDCNSFDSDEAGCGTQMGCSWGWCSGTPNGCSTYDEDQSSCTDEGCSWDGCTGTPYPCDFWTVPQQCIQSACTWDGCTGNPTACGTYSNDVDCGGQGGCEWSWNTDCSGAWVVCPATAAVNTPFNVSYGADSQSDPDSGDSYTSLSLYRTVPASEQLNCTEQSSTGDDASTGNYPRNITEISTGSKTYEARCYAGGSTGNCANSESTDSCVVSIVVTSQSNATLSQGWNMVSFVIPSVDTGTDKTIRLSADGDGWNLIGHSSSVSVNLSDVQVIAGTTYTWQQAVSAGKVQAYLRYMENGATKYVATPDLKMNDYALRTNIGYWIKVNEEANITLPDAGGILLWQNYSYNSIVFHNGTLQKNITDALAAGWIYTGGYNRLYYYSEIDRSYKNLCGAACTKDKLTSWEGYFIWSNVDSLRITIQN